MERESVEPNPFFGPDAVLAAARHLAHGADAELLAVLDGPRMVAALPVVRVRRWRKIPVPATVGWRHDYCFLGTPLVAPDAIEEGLAALLHRSFDAGSPSLLVFEWLALDGPVAAALRSLTGPRLMPMERFERAALHRSGEVSSERSLSKERRRSLKRRRKALEAALGGPLELTDLAGGDGTAVGEAVASFLRLEAAGWKGREGTALASRPGDAAFFTELCLTAAASGQLNLTALTHENQLIAVQCAIASGGWEFYVKTAYDENLSQGSPGIQLAVELMRRFDETPGGPASIDACTPPDSALWNELFPDRRSIGTVAIADPSLRGRALSRLLPPARRAWSSARALRDARGQRAATPSGP